MKNLAHEETYKGCKIELVYDDSPESPREWDNVGTMVCWHRRYNLVLPLYLYDHSGISISTGKFSCPWDSGRVGFIYCSKERARQEWGEKYSPGITDDAIFAKALACLESEVSAYDSYLQGDVVGYVASDPDGEELGSCWGFYPDADYATQWDYAIGEARAYIDRWAEEQAAEALERAHWEARDVETINP
jgi:hypothetical protein